MASRPKVAFSECANLSVVEDTVKDAEFKHRR